MKIIADIQKANVKKAKDDVAESQAKLEAAKKNQDSIQKQLNAHNEQEKAIKDKLNEVENKLGDGETIETEGRSAEIQRTKKKNAEILKANKDQIAVRKSNKKISMKANKKHTKKMLKKQKNAIVIQIAKCENSRKFQTALARYKTEKDLVDSQHKKAKEDSCYAPKKCMSSVAMQELNGVIQGCKLGRNYKQFKKLKKEHKHLVELATKRLDLSTNLIERSEILLADSWSGFNYILLNCFTGWGSASVQLLNTYTQNAPSISTCEALFPAGSEHPVCSRLNGTGQSVPDMKHSVPG